MYYFIMRRDTAFILYNMASEYQDLRETFC